LIFFTLLNFEHGWGVHPRAVKSWAPPATEATQGILDLGFAIVDFEDSSVVFRRRCLVLSRRRRRFFGSFSAAAASAAPLTQFLLSWIPY
jgi:hypothetical protein